MSAISLEALPDEVVYTILIHAGPYSAAAIQKTSQRFYRIANTAALWRHYCLTHFQFWDKRHNIFQKIQNPSNLTPWKEIFINRYFTHKRVTESLRSIVNSQVGRLKKSHSIASFGYDAKDTLLYHIQTGADDRDHLALR